ncbi:31281_t:CDS:2 [Gigaspora margarita]|uniref:31281_t:CDS:1 n=1 Tax=Gigaspora margarita TaxID=4874 RepID=A0ABM8W1D0_GIGMA|nr:31281_t:CDS:2 [Gigaspora margarita]
MEKEFLPHLNTQTNSNLSWSFLTIPRLFEFWDSCPKKLNYLAIADYYPYEIGNFLRGCKEKNIKPVWGVKIFVVNEKGKRYSATIYPQNNRAGKEIIAKLFAPASPPNRTFAWDYVLNHFSKNYFVVGEVQQLDEINFFSQFITANSNIFIGLNFFLLDPTQHLSHAVISRLIPFSAIKVKTEKEVDLLNLVKKTAFGTKSRKVKEDNTSLLTLKSKCWQQLLTLKREHREDYQKVLEKELATIEKLDYVDYFLLFSEVADYLRSQNIIIGPGRGSAVSSLVVYLLGITSIDPLQHNLFFERFLNEKRKKLPDIDLDVESQEEVFNYLRKKYSPTQVARIVTRKKIALIERIQDLYYDTSIHPSGVVIAERSLVGTIPTKSEKDFLITFFEENQLTQLGFKKYDFLSLKETLGFVSLIKGLNSPSTPNKLPSYHEVDFTDSKTWDLMANFCLTGIFQLDTATARSLFTRFRPSNFSELVIFLALNRPGMKKRVEEIICRKSNREKPTFISPILTKIFAATFGFIIFEEQISQILALVYDCSFAEAEVKRREIALTGLAKDFLVRARQQKLPRADAELLHQQITSARGYTFNKAHAVAYGYLTYYIAYLKANFSPEFIVYFLNEKKDKVLVCLQEAFAQGFGLQKPDINCSQMVWSQKENNLVMGFSSLKNCQAIDIASLESGGPALFRYLQLRQKLPAAKSTDLPFLDFSAQPEKSTLKITNQQLAKSKQISSLLATFRDYNNQEVTVDIYAVICQVEKNDVRSSFKLEIKDQDYRRYQEILVDHNELLFTCQIQIKDHKINFINFKEAKDNDEDQFDDEIIETK